MAEPWAELQGIADRRTAAFRRAFVDAVSRAGSTAVKAGIEQAIRLGQTERAYLIAVAAWEKSAQVWRLEVSAQLRRVFEEGAAAGSRAVGIEAKFDIVNPHAIEWVRASGALLVTRVNDAMKASIRAVIEQSLRGDFTVRESATLIRQLGIGLTDGQAMAVINYRFGLLEAGASPTQVAIAAERYRQRLLAERSMTIARTETLNAANGGQLEAWRQHEAAGLLGPGVLKFWIVTPDDRLCPICRLIGQQAPRRITEPFITPDGRQIQGPTAHPRCRCALGLKRTAARRAA